MLGCLIGSEGCAHHQGFWVNAQHNVHKRRRLDFTAEGYFQQQLNKCKQHAPHPAALNNRLARLLACWLACFLACSLAGLSLARSLACLLGGLLAGLLACSEQHTRLWSGSWNLWHVASNVGKREAWPTTMPVSWFEAMFESEQKAHEQNGEAWYLSKRCGDEHCHSECAWQSHRKVVGRWTTFSAVAPPKAYVAHVHVAFFSLIMTWDLMTMFCDCMAWDLMKSCFCKAPLKLASGLRNWRLAACTEKRDGCLIFLCYWGVCWANEGIRIRCMY